MNSFILVKNSSSKVAFTLTSPYKLSANPIKKTMFLLKPAFLFLLFLFSVSFAQAATKTWAGGVGTGFDWNLGSNWSGGMAPVSGDDITFNTGSSGYVVFSTMPSSISYNSLTANGYILFANGVATTLTIGGKDGTDFTIPSNRELSLSTNVNITLTANSAATIDGTLEIHNSCTYYIEGAVTTVNGKIDNIGGTVTSSSPSNLVFNSFATYNHLRKGGAVPKAKWNATSTCNIEFAGMAEFEPTGLDPSSFDQTFGNLIWNVDQNRVLYSFAPYLKTVQGNLDIKQTGSSEYELNKLILTDATSTLVIGGSLKVGGYVIIEGGTVNTGNTAISRNYNEKRAVLTINSGTLNTTALTVGPHTTMSSDGNIFYNPFTILNLYGGTINVNGDLIIYPSCRFTCANTPSLNIKGNMTNNGNYLKDRETVTFNGGSVQSIQGSSVSTFYNLTIKNSAGVTLPQSDAHVWNTLTFENGKITTGSRTLMLDVNATPVSGAGVGKYVYGNMGISVPANSTSRIFTIGDASNYTPVTLTFSGTATNSIGNIVASTKTGDHPNIGSNGIYGIDPAKSLNRYFTLTNNGVTFGTYSAAFTFIPTDLDGGTDPLIFMVQRFSPNSWYSTTIGTRTATTVQITGATQTEFGDFEAGQMKCSTPTAFTVTGGGSACGTNTGVVVGLSGSQAGVTYQLMLNGTIKDSPVSGGGSAINFGEQPVGTYTVVASRVTGGCYSTMTGSAIVTP